MHTHTPTPVSPVPLPLREPSFVVGQNRRGQWLALASDGSCGGIFADRESAIRFAATETNRQPNAVRLTGDLIELRF